MHWAQQRAGEWRTDSPPKSFEEEATTSGRDAQSTFDSCVVPINPCPKLMFTSSSSSFSPLSRALENQSQPPTPVTPTPYSCHPIPYTRQLAPVTYTGSIQCSTPYTVDPKPQALDPTPLALQRAGPRLAAPLAQIHLAALRASRRHHVAAVCSRRVPRWHASFTSFGHLDLNCAATASTCASVPQFLSSRKDSCGSSTSRSSHVSVISPSFSLQKCRWRRRFVCLRVLTHLLLSLSLYLYVYCLSVSKSISI